MPRALVSDQVFRRLCDDIVAGVYVPGEKLPTQRALAADLGVNMASVREAVKRLEQLRLVEVRHGDAMRVRDWRAAPGSTSSPTCCWAAVSTPRRSRACSKRGG